MQSTVVLVYFPSMLLYCTSLHMLMHLSVLTCDELCCTYTHVCCSQIKVWAADDYRQLSSSNLHRGSVECFAVTRAGTAVKVHLHAAVTQFDALGTQSGAAGTQFDASGIHCGPNYCDMELMSLSQPGCTKALL